MVADRFHDNKKQQMKQATPNGFTPFRRKKYYAVGGIVLVVVGMGLFFLPEDASMMKYVLSGIVLVTGLLALCSYLVSRIDIDDEKIVYRNLFGCIRQMRWEDVRQVMDGIDMDRNMLLVGEHTKIKITYGFARFDALRDILLEKTR